MDKDKIIDIIDNINDEDNKMKLKIFKNYIKDFQTEIDNICGNLGELFYNDIVSVSCLNIPDETQKYGQRFEYCLKVGCAEYIKFDLNKNKLTDMIEVFEKNKEFLKEEAIKLVNIMNINFKDIMLKLNHISDDLKNSDACIYLKDNWNILKNTLHYHSERATFVITIRIDKFVSYCIEIPLYLKFSDNEYKQLLENINRAVNKTLADSILKRYEMVEKKYNKERFKCTYNHYGQKICKINPNVEAPKLSLTEKYILVDYALKYKDYNLAEKMYIRKSNLPRHLKEKLYSIVVMKKLMNPA